MTNQDKSDMRLALVVLFTVGLICFFAGKVSAGIIWREGVKVVEFDADSEVFTSLQDGKIVSGDAGGFDGAMQTGYIDGGGVIIYDKETGNVKRKYGKTD